MCLRFVFVNFDAMYSSPIWDVAYFDMNDVEKGQLWHKLKYVRLDDNASSQSPSPIWHLGSHSHPVSHQLESDTWMRTPDNSGIILFMGSLNIQLASDSQKIQIIQAHTSYLSPTPAPVSKFSAGAKISWSNTN